MGYSPSPTPGTVTAKATTEASCKPSTLISTLPSKKRVERATQKATMALSRLLINWFGLIYLRYLSRVMGRRCRIIGLWRPSILGCICWAYDGREEETVERDEWRVGVHARG